MKNISGAQEVIKGNRWKLLKYCFVVALGCSLISLCFQGINNNALPLIITLIINVCFLFISNLLYLKAASWEPYSFKDFKVIITYGRKLLPLLLIYALVIVLGTILLLFASRQSILVVAIPGLVAVIVMAFNCINHLSLFVIYKENKGTLAGIRSALRLFISSKRLFAQIMFKSFMVLIVGSFLIYVVNVFVYARQLSPLLEAAVVDKEAIEAYFSTNLSYLVQSIGMQLVVSYISIISGITYGTY